MPRQGIYRRRPAAGEGVVGLLGQRVIRREDLELLTVGGTFVADASAGAPDGWVHIGFVRSPVAHAAIVEVDTAAALAHPGVVGVFAAGDAPPGPLPPALPGFPPELSQPLIASDRVRYVGEAVAAVVTEQVGQLEDAMEAVWVEYEPLPAVVDPEVAALDETVIFAALGSNVASRLHAGAGDEVDLFEGCEVVVSDTLAVPRVAPCPLEVRGAASVWDRNGRLRHVATTQAPHAVKARLCSVLGLAPADVRVVVGDVGGGFGSKFGCYPEDILTAWAARRLGRPTKWVETRRDSMVGLHHGRGQVLRVRLGGRRDGKVTAYALDITQDAGAYASLGVYAPEPTIRMASGPYDIRRIRATARAVVTNTTPVSAYRGTGRPEAAHAIERAMDLFALAIGRDPVEVRRTNLIPCGSFPFTTAVQTTYEQGDYGRALAKALAAAGYHGLRANQARIRESGHGPLLGVGVSVYVESAGSGPPSEHGRVTMRADGTAVVATGTSPHGQGHVTSWSMIAADILGIRLEDVSVVHGDTDAVPTGMGTFASRSVQLGGNAVHQASVRVVERGRVLAAQLLEVDADDVVFDPAGATFHVVGSPTVTRSWTDVAAVAGPEGIVECVDFTGSTTYPFGAHVAVVQVDAETGATQILRLVSVDDAGRLVNPVIAEGQRHGGIAQGVAEALYEEFRYDPHGTPLTASLADYSLVSAREMPSFELVASETPIASNPLGAMGIGESGTVGSLAAVHSAVCDAVAHLGVRHVGMPATPERVWRAIRDAGQGR
jgi:carbon-monoxide dehydrogenase large subunit